MFNKIQIQIRNYSKFTHIDKEGNFKMVDVGNKNITNREAQAKAIVNVGPELAIMLRDGVNLKKGNESLIVARLAGVIGGKKTSELIPLCHQLSLRYINIDVDIDCIQGKIIFISTVKVDGKTGCEMEALTAVSIASLTLYDMCKAINEHISIENIKLIKKSGGKSGDFNGC